MWQHPEKNTPHLMLDLGSGDPADGEVQPEGYVLNDVEAHPWIDLVCDIRDLPKFVKPKQCCQIRMSHVLEHFGTHEVDDILKMLYNLIEVGGSILIYVPNFIWHASLVARGQEEEGIMYAFGGQKDAYDYHKTGFTPSILEKKLRLAGFDNISIIDGTSLEAIAYVLK